MLARTKILGLMLAVTMVASSPLLVHAEGGNHSHKGFRHHEHHDKMFTKVLDLNEEQEKQLKSIRDKQKEAAEKLEEQIKTNRNAFYAEIAKASADTAKITELQNQFKAIQTQMADEKLSSLLEIKKVLTAEQFAGYMALKKQKKMMMHHGQKWGHKGKHGHQHKDHQDASKEESPIKE